MYPWPAREKCPMQAYFRAPQSFLTAAATITGSSFKCSEACWRKAEVSWGSMFGQCLGQLAHLHACQRVQRESQRETERHRDRKREKDEEQGRERERERRSKMSGWLSGGLPPGGFESYEKLRKPKKTFTEAGAATPQTSGTIPWGGGGGGPRPEARNHIFLSLCH